jgi:hypothetical protein
LEFKDMFAAANNTVIWLVVVSFFLAKVRWQFWRQCIFEAALHPVCANAFYVLGTHAAC